MVRFGGAGKRGQTASKQPLQLTYRQKIKHGKTVHVCWGQPMDTLFQEMLGGVGRLQEDVGVTPFLKDRHEGRKKTTSSYWQPRQEERETRCLFKAYHHFGSLAKLAIYW